VDELDLLRYFHADPETNVIMLYIEELQRGPEFIEAVKEITGGDRPTPVLVIKSGRTSAGAQAAASHTGALAGTEAVYDAIFEQSGIIRVDSIDELFDFANAFALQERKRPGQDAAQGAQRQPGGHRHQCRRPRHRGHGHDRVLRPGTGQHSPETIEVLASHLPSGRQRPQSRGRHRGRGPGPL
jgi:hypothetical protein